MLILETILNNKNFENTKKYSKIRNKTKINYHALTTTTQMRVVFDSDTICEDPNPL